MAMRMRHGDSHDQQLAPQEVASGQGLPPGRCRLWAAATMAAGPYRGTGGDIPPSLSFPFHQSTLADPFTAFAPGSACPSSSVTVNHGSRGYHPQMSQSGWQTIESDAGVFTYLLAHLGCPSIQFSELLTLDPADLDALGPVHGVIFLFKYPTGSDAPKSSDASKPLDGTFDHDAAQKLFFASQVIQNACGTQALLSVLLNKDDRESDALTGGDKVDIGASLRDFRDFTISFDPMLRGEALSNSELIRESHNAFSRSSPFADETAHDPQAESDDVFHFIAYTALNGTLYEIDGLQAAPISHGPCASAAEFPVKVVEVLQRRIARYPAGEIRFNLLAMVQDQRLVCKERGDWEGVEREEARRKEWAWENALRKHNFVGFAGEVLKGVIRTKTQEGDEQYGEWVKEAKGAMKKRAQAGRPRRAGAGAMKVD
ncbi:hypothetical protein FH972_025438 [Carpinus fangiana]|uniref:Ubiquitin carboxyl-terminal hydrolase n=1 Tax=Carpinus fangiana TaxID=176857 RepID=A0A5N6L116_9ROSI|nr:hypothetical protein FH972_025438 [Carpinus fangiana]